MNDPIAVIENHLMSLPETVIVNKESIIKRLISKNLQPVVLRTEGFEGIEYKVLSAKQRILSFFGFGDASLRKLLQVIDNKLESVDLNEDKKKLASKKTDDHSHTIYLHIIGKMIGNKITTLSQEILSSSLEKEKSLASIYRELESINDNNELIYLVFQSIPLEILVAFPLSSIDTIQSIQLESVRNRLSSVNRITRFSLGLEEDALALQNDTFTTLRRDWKKLIQKIERQTQIQLLRTLTGIKTFNKSYIRLAD